MVVGRESVGPRERLDRGRDFALEFRRRADVDHAPAVQTQEMVMVLGKFFGEFEARELVVR